MVNTTDENKLRVEWRLRVAIARKQVIEVI
jgi:hypothetical protein